MLNEYCAKFTEIALKVGLGAVPDQEYFKLCFHISA